MFLSVFYYCISAFLCCRRSFNPSLCRLSFFLSQLQSLLLFVIIHFHDNFNFLLAARGSEERRTTARGLPFLLSYNLFQGHVHCYKFTLSRPHQGLATS